MSSDGAPIAEAISKQAIEHNADLLVLGAYSRPRMTEILFGGTTRSLLANAPSSRWLCGKAFLKPNVRASSS